MNYSIFKRYSKLNTLLETKSNAEVMKSHDVNNSNTDIKMYFEHKAEEAKNDTNSSEIISKAPQ